MGFFCWGWVGRKKRVDPGKFPYQIKKKSLSHCQGFIQDFELGEGGNFHVLAKGGGGGGGGGEK